MNYREAIGWLFGTQTFGIKLGLDGPRRLLREFAALAPAGAVVLHVAGTNGKGSTCAMAEAIARAAGRRTGLFTSPHLIDFRERIRVGGEEIPEAEAAAGLSDLRRLCAGLDPHPTFFEIALALAMRWFARCGCDFIVLETGMGGRFDATTAVPATVCAITPIGLDHTQYLGESLELIAAEKAGIFLPGVPAVSAPQRQEAQAVLARVARETGSPLTFVGVPLAGPAIALPGMHQAWNAALAVAAVELAGLRADAATVGQALATVKWPGRFEIFPAGAVPGIAAEIVLDGAHNPDAAAVLADTWRRIYPSQRPELVCGAASDKDLAGMLAILAPLASRIHLCPINSPRAVSVATLAASLPPDSPPHLSHPEMAVALAAAAAGGGPVLVAGSLFLAGEARALLTGRRFQQSSQ